MCADYLKLGVHAYMFCFAVQFSFCVKAVSVTTRSLTFEGAEDVKKKDEEVMLDQD